MKKMKKKRRANKTFVKTEDDKRRQKTGRKIKCGKKWEREAVRERGSVWECERDAH